MPKFPPEVVAEIRPKDVLRKKAFDKGMAQFRETQRLYQRETIDLLQVFSLTDLDTQWANLKDIREAGGARYIGVTVSTSNLYERLTQFLQSEQPDFVQINYSISERGAEARMLPMLRDRGIGVLINRPFMNGDLFGKLADVPVDGDFPFLHLESKFMHLGFHIYDVGFQSPNVEAARPLVYATALLLVLVIIVLNLSAIQIRNRLREKYRAFEH